VEKADRAAGEEQGGSGKKSSSFFAKSSSFASGLKVPDIKMPKMPEMPSMKEMKMPSLFGKSKNAEGPAGRSPEGAPRPGQGGDGASAGRHAAAASAAPGPQEAAAAVGSRVMVQGLSKAAQYNGKFGIVSEIIDKDGEERLCVVLEGSGRQLSVKRANAQVVKARPAAGGSNPMSMALNSMFKPKLSASGGTNLYEELGVSSTATEKEIKVAYYRLARDWHPDKNPDDPNAEGRFKRISEAYQVLSDPRKRQIYDQLGADGLQDDQKIDLDAIKFQIQMLFGAGEFDDILGDVCELPEVKHLLEQLVEELLTSQRGGAAAPGSKDMPEEYAAAEDEYCKGLSRKLMARLEARVKVS